MIIYRIARYNIVSLFELSEEQQQVYIDDCNGDFNQALETFYAVNINDENDTFNLADFMCCDGQRWQGVMSCTNTNGYGLILSADGEQAIIALIG